MGLTWTRTAGLWPPLMLTRPTPGSWEIFWANLVSARSSTCGRGRVFEVSASVRIGRVGGVYLAVDGRDRQVCRQEGEGAVDRRLDLLLRHVEARDPG